MPVDNEAADEIKTAFATARKRDLNFGFCIGKKFDTCVLITHRTKSPDVLARQAKKEGETAKITFGTMRVKGKILSMTCEDDPPAGCARKAKDFFSKGVGIKMKVVLLDASGNVVEAAEDEDDERDEDIQTDNTAETEADPAQTRWAAVEKKLSPLVEAALANATLETSKLEAAWNMAVQYAGDGKYAQSLKIASKIPPLLKGEGAEKTTGGGNESTTNTDPNPAQQQWDKVSPKVALLYENVMKLNPSDRSKLEASWAMATEKAEGGDFKTALKVIERLVPSLKKILADGAGGESATASQGEPPKGVVAFQKARVLWSGTRTKMKTEVGKLEKAILDVCGSNEDLKEAADEAKNLTSRLDVFDERLEDTLDEITNTPDGPAREKLKIQAKKQIGEYASALKEGFFQDIDSNNGFVSLSVTASASQSLKEIAGALR